MRPFLSLILCATAGCRWGAPAVDATTQHLPAGVRTPANEGPAPAAVLCEGDDPPPACFRPIDGGTFVMGAQPSDPAQPAHDPRARPDEGPPRSVTLPAFWATASEIPYWMYRRCTIDGACPPLDPTLPEPPILDLPASQISWEEARAVCAWLGGRLPSEAEWEYLARAGDGRRYPWSSNPVCPPNTAPALESQTQHRDAILHRCGRVSTLIFDRLAPPELDTVGKALDLWAVDEGAAVCAELAALPDEQVPAATLERARRALAEAEAGISPLRCDRTDIVPVMASADKHPWRLFGLAGNVFEWVADGYDAGFYARAPATSPQAPPAERHVIRGGSYLSDLGDWRTTARVAMPATARSADVGVRCVRDSAP